MKVLDEKKKEFSGKSAIVLGNGPSLNNLDFNLIKDSPDVITFATNQIADLCKQNNWKPDIYSSFFCGPFRGKKYKTLSGKMLNYEGSLEKAIEAQNDIRYITNNLETICFVHDWYKIFLEEKENIHFINPILWNRHKDFPSNGFDKFKLPKKFLWHCATAPLFQMCFYFGFKRIAIVGQDGYGGGKVNHFANYKGNKLNTDEHIIRANRSIYNLHNAVSNYAKKKKLSIYNLSEISIIDHYSEISLHNYLNQIDS